jgi:hypothetical protein
VNTLKGKTSTLDVEASDSSGLHFQVVAEANVTKSCRSPAEILVQMNDCRGLGTIAVALEAVEFQ